jgi:hypothetical protein
MPVNWRKGLNRLFVVVTVAWATYVLFIIPMQQRRENARRHGEAFELCLSTEAASSRDAVAKASAARCIQDAQNLLRSEDAEYSWRNWTSNYRVLIYFVILPPVVVYLLLWLVWAVIAWVTRGFRQRPIQI